ncbi:MAG: type II secretion system secretin GspD [Proteobacteria bacterium]|nr:type II secretion system secretin GspD [Pseudomonadota bacterium]
MKRSNSYLFRLAGVVVIIFFIVLQPSRAEDTFTLNMENADIHTFIMEISPILGKTIVIDPGVQGEVTIISKRKLSKQEVYRVFLSTLHVHGFTAIEIDGLIKVIPNASAREDANLIYDPARTGIGDEYVTGIIQLKYANAPQIIPVIRPLVSKTGHLAAYGPSNVIIFTDRANNVTRIKRLLREVDKASNNQVEIIPLKHASAADVVRMLQDIEQRESKNESISNQQLSFVADERMNAILISGEASARAKTRALITQIDAPLEGALTSIKVVYLHNADASNVAEVLNSIKSTLITEYEDGAIAVESNIMIHADQSINALVISAPPDIMLALESVIRQLDIRRLQVLVEAIIVEVEQGHLQEFGAQVLLGTSHFRLFSNVDASGNNPNVGDLAPIVTGNTEEIADVLGGLSGGNVGVGLLSNDVTFAVLIRAIRGETGANILSQPSIITLDNEEASIVVGQEVPFITGQSLGSNNSNPFQTIVRKEVGVKLRITPHINQMGGVRLKIIQEVSSVQPTVENRLQSDLITNKRQLETTVLVDDGATVVLGGLIDEVDIITVQKVPVLGDIPLLGNLFRSTKTTKVKKNLMIFIRPTVIKDTAKYSHLSNRKYENIRNKQLELQSKGIEIMNEEAPAVLLDMIMD